MIIDICPVCGADVDHFYDAEGRIVLDENGVSLWVCVYPSLHPVSEETHPPVADPHD